MKTVQPRKQHKMLHKAPLHIRYKHFSAPLAPSVKASYNFNSIPVRTGDTVRIMRGDRKGMEGKVTRIDRERYRLFVEGITREKVDGSTAPVPIHPSKVMITNLNLEDKWREETLKVRAEKAEKKTEKPEKEGRKRKPRKSFSKEAKTPREINVEQAPEEKGETENG
jgi:large subunit ribosomal protein L24